MTLNDLWLLIFSFFEPFCYGDTFRNSAASKDRSIHKVGFHVTFSIHKVGFYKVDFHVYASVCWGGTIMFLGDLKDSNILTKKAIN